MALDPAKFKAMVRGTARSVSSKYPSYVEQLDTEQHLWLWLYEKRASILKTVEDDPQNWEAKIASTMRKVASDYCAREKAAIEGYEQEGSYLYTVEAVKSMLTELLATGQWAGQPDRVELIDLKEALSHLPAETVRLLYMQYAQSYTMEMIASEFECSTEAAKKRAQRAVGALQRALGYKDPLDTPGPSDRRTVRSNAAARADLSRSWEG